MQNMPVLSTEESAQKVAETCKYPRVTKEAIEAKIDDLYYRKEGHLTICVITMKNGFYVLGHSAPADPRNYDKDVGERYAYDNAFKQLWQLEGYLLRDKIANEST